jgi:hypothetical protein
VSNGYERIIMGVDDKESTKKDGVVGWTDRKTRKGRRVKASEGKRERENSRSTNEINPKTKMKKQ